MSEAKRKGRPPRPPRTVITVVQRAHGKRHHFYSVTVEARAFDVMKAIQFLARDWKEIHRKRD